MAGRSSRDFRIVKSYNRSVPKRPRCGGWETSGATALSSCLKASHSLGSQNGSVSFGNRNKSGGGAHQERRELDGHECCARLCSQPLSRGEDAPRPGDTHQCKVWAAPGGGTVGTAGAREGGSEAGRGFPGIREDRDFSPEDRFIRSSAPEIPKVNLKK